MATPATLPDTPHAISGNNRPNMFGTGVTESDGINEIIDDLYNAYTRIGIGTATPDAVHKTIKATASGETSWDYHTMVKLGEVSGTGASGVLEIASIPAVFRAIEVHLFGRSDTAATSAGVRMTFETSPTAGAYDHQQMSGLATATAAAENIGASDFIVFAAVPAASSAANLYGASRSLILEYANTGTFKTVVSSSAEPASLASGGFTVRTTGGLWESPAAISRVRATLSAGNWTTASKMTILGIP